MNINGVRCVLKKNISSYLNILLIFFKLIIFIRILFSLARTIIFDDRIEYVIIVIIRLLTNLFEQHLKWERDLKRRDVIYIYSPSRGHTYKINNIYIYYTFNVKILLLLFNLIKCYCNYVLGQQTTNGEKTTSKNKSIASAFENSYFGFYQNRGKHYFIYCF